MNELQICANSCAKAVDNMPCAHCPVQQTLNACRSTRIIKQLDQSIAKTDELTDSMLERSANRADWAVLCGFALFIAISVMWFFSQSKPVVSMCGGV